MTTLRRLLNDCSGATAIEYGLLVALLSVVIVAGSRLTGERIEALFASIATATQ